MVEFKVNSMGYDFWPALVVYAIAALVGIFSPSTLFRDTIRAIVRSARSMTSRKFAFREIGQVALIVLAIQVLTGFPVAIAMGVTDQNVLLLISPGSSTRWYVWTSTIAELFVGWGFGSTLAGFTLPLTTDTSRSKERVE